MLTASQTVHENRIYSLKIHCGDKYPDQPPSIQFVSRVNLPFVSQVDGKVDPSKLPILANWTRNQSLETVLVEIRRSATPAWPHLPPNANLAHAERWPASTTGSFLNHRKDRRSEMRRPQQQAAICTCN